MPGYAVRNLLRGDIGAAGRNVADFGLNIIDAALPGDWIPEISGEKDRPNFQDVVGPIDDGILGSAIDLAGNIATDPLTYVPGAALAKGAGAVAKGVKAVTPKIVQEGVAKIAQPAGKYLRKVAGAERIGKPLANVITAAQGAKDVTGLAGHEAIAAALKDATPREMQAAQEVLANRTVARDPTLGYQRALDESGTMSVQDRLARYLTDNPDVDPAKLANIVTGVGDYFKTKFDVGKSSGIGGNIFKEMGGQPVSDVVMGAVPGTTGSQGIRDYFPQVFKKTTDEEIADQLGNPNFLSERKLTTPADVSTHLANNLDQEIDTDLLGTLARYNQQSAETASKAATGQGLFGLAREAGTELPDELLQKALAQQRLAQPAKAVVGPSETAMTSDVADMLSGGARQGPRAAEAELPNAFEKTSFDPHGQADKWLFEQNMKEAQDGLGLAGQSGKSVVGKSTAITSGLSADEKQQARNWLLSQDYKHTDPLLKETAQAIAKNLPGDEADVALHFLKGMPSAQGLTKQLGKLNSHFKKFAVFGAIIPKLGAITRNVTSGLFQKYSTPEARGFISPKNAPQFMRDWFASIEDGIEHLTGKRVFTKNEFAQVDNAFKQSGGDPRKALAFITDPIMRAAAEKGVLGNNFVDTEHLIAKASQSGIRDVGNRLMNYPASMFRGAESRMRYGLFKDMVKSGKSADDAARTVRDAFFDYGVSSKENQAARSLLPFFQYTAKAVPQQANLMAEKPWIASVIGNLMSPGRDEPVNAQMEGKLNIPIGRDERGNKQYITSLGLPFETLGTIPNPSANLSQFGRQVEQNIVGSSQPLLKSAFAAVSGEDPYFGTPFQSYQRVAGQDLGQVGGSINTLLGTGLPGATPIQGLLGTAGKLADERTSLGETAANLLTGSRITSVDPNKALQQRLQSYLETRPDIQQYRGFFQTDKNPDTQALLDAMKAAHKKIKDEKKAQASVN